jgi:hypothetical protein
VKPATWFELVDDDQLIAFSRPLLTTFSRPVAVGELVGGPLGGTRVLIRVQPRDEPTQPGAEPRPARAAAGA